MESYARTIEHTIRNFFLDVKNTRHKDLRIRRLHMYPGARILFFAWLDNMDWECNGPRIMRFNTKPVDAYLR